MEHQALEERITAYLLGDATPEQAEQIRRHLDECASCRALAQELQSTLDLLRDALAAESPAPARLDPARREAVFRSRSPRWMEWFDTHRFGLAWAGAAAAVTAILGFLLLPTRPSANRTNANAAIELAQAAPREHDKQWDFSLRREPAAPPPADRKPEQAQERFEAPPRTGQPMSQSARGVAAADRPADLKALGQELSHFFDGDHGGAQESDFGAVLSEEGESRSAAIAGAVVDAEVSGPVPAEEGVALGRPVSRSAGRAGLRGAEFEEAGAGAYRFAFGSSSANGAVAVPDSASELGERVSGSGLGAKTDATAPARPTHETAAAVDRTLAPDAARYWGDVSMLHQARREARDNAKMSAAFDENGDTFALAAAPPPASGRATPGDELIPVFLGYGVNPYQDVSRQPLSTFGIDVDTASYTLARRYILDGTRPPPDAVRTEEFVNFFDYDYRPPSARAFAVYAFGAPAPFGEGVLFQVGVKGKVLGRDDQKAAVLTFVVDTSGSMDTAERLGLVKTSLKLLLGELDPADRVAIVQVNSEARLVLEHTPAAEADAIRAAIDGLQCTGSTHLDAGIELGYQVAARGFVGGAVNRVLILSDGAANLGSANPDEILARVEASRKQGILCSVFGFGLGTYNDVMLETLANRGDGAYRFIDSEAEARRVFVDDLSAALQVIARDVKIQVEFSPRRVARYRQLGYENRQLPADAFRNDAVDAGEVGSGQSVTALYELILTGEADGPLGTVRVRYRDENSGAVEEITREVQAADLHASANEAGPRFQLAAAAAEFAELLRNSPFAVNGSFAALADALRPVALHLHRDQRVAEFLHLVQRAHQLPPPPKPRVSP